LLPLWVSALHLFFPSSMKSRDAFIPPILAIPHLLTLRCGRYS
jgi:hypothetical protein